MLGMVEKFLHIDLGGEQAGDEVAGAVEVLDLTLERINLLGHRNRLGKLDFNVARNHKRGTTKKLPPNNTRIILAISTTNLYLKAKVKRRVILDLSE